MTIPRRPSGAHRAPLAPARRSGAVARPVAAGGAEVAPEAVEALMDLAAALQKHGTYPPGHPMLAPAVDRAAAALQRATADRDVLVVGVATGRVAVDGVPVPGLAAVVGDLAARLQRRELAGLRILRGVTREEVGDALAAIVGGEGPPARRFWPHLRLTLAREQRPSGSVPALGAGAPTAETLARWQRLASDEPEPLRAADARATLLDAVRGLPPRDAVRATLAAAARAGSPLAPWHVRLLERLAEQERAAPDDDDVRRGCRAALLASVAGLDAADDAAGDRSCALTDDGDAARLLRVALDVGVVSRATARAADELVAREGPTALLGIVDDADACAPEVRELLRERVLSVSALRRALDMPEPDWPAIERLVSVLGARCAAPLADAVVTATPRTRQYAIARVMRACPHVADQIAERLGGATRATQRVLLHALREIGGPAPLDVARFVRHPDAALRAAAARVLLASAPDAARARRDALRSGDPHLVRLGVRAALRRSCADDAAPLRAVAADATVPIPVRTIALRALGAHEDAASRACLLDVARRAAGTRRRVLDAATASLGTAALRVLAAQWSGDPDARAALDLARRSAHAAVRRAAGGVA